MKTIRVYQLYWDLLSGPSPYSINYGGWNKQIWQVAAKSIKQAIFLAANDEWKDDLNDVGILAYTPGNSVSASWTVWFTDDKQINTTYKHYEKYKGN